MIEAFPLPMFSRRTFLQLMGVTTLATFNPTLLSRALPVSSEQPWARALRPAPVYAFPSAIHPVDRLWPDSLVRLYGQNGEWYHTEKGYVSRLELQPIEPFNPDITAFIRIDQPFWGMVAGPAAAVRQYCAADAPLVTRIGHGGVMKVVDSLPGEPYGWYGLADADEHFVGWSQAVMWRPATTEVASFRLSGITIDRQRQTLMAIAEDQTILESAASVGKTIPVGTFQVQRKLDGGVAIDQHVGAPWLLDCGALQLSGAYWHNHFGEAIAGQGVQLPPALARWLFSAVDQDSEIVII